MTSGISGLKISNLSLFLPIPISLSPPLSLFLCNPGTHFQICCSRLSLTIHEPFSISQSFYALIGRRLHSLFFPPITSRPNPHRLPLPPSPSRHRDSLSLSSHTGLLCSVGLNLHHSSVCAVSSRASWLNPIAADDRFHPTVSFPNASVCISATPVFHSSLLVRRASGARPASAGLSCYCWASANRWRATFSPCRVRGLQCAASCKMGFTAEKRRPAIDLTHFVQTVISGSVSLVSLPPCALLHSCPWNGLSSNYFYCIR